ncbi:hypothetical protein [Caldalkalibacillus mannanilyticus]|uniref:hypothetical protein n=1 Tax=Caldalkalibacillus mannanilyticus TaxID=1418 RepID=UPI00046A6E3A|nr:hypothetical protein [Caldalkalibacillus mannanilyticus]
MELGRKKIGDYEFIYNPLTTEIYVSEEEEMWEVEIYKLKHFLGTLEVNRTGDILIIEDLGLELVKLDEKQIEVR